MATVEFGMPVKGVSRGLPLDKEPPLTSGDMNNVRPRDVLENRIRMGQRPGLDKRYTQQIGGTAAVIVAICDVVQVIT
ncbi:MAG: hypothetical protein ACYTEO_18540 [Planctomycetota bacterium]|jgi:hypothetical protein